MFDNMYQDPAPPRDLERRLEEYRQELQFFGSVFNTAQVIILILDPAGRIVRFNPYLEKISGWTLAEVKGRQWFETFLPEPNHGAIRAVFDDAIQGIPTAGTVNPIRTKDGRELLIEWHNVNLTDPDGHITGVLATGQDITERRRAEERQRKLEAKLEQAQRLESLGVLAGGIAHDFNNLLQGIIGGTSLARSELPSWSPVREIIQEVETTAFRAAELTSQMLAYSGKGRFVIERVDLGDLVRELAPNISRALSKTTVIKYDLAPGAVEGDAAQLRQVVINFITNADEAMGEAPGVIKVAAGTMVCGPGLLDRAYLNAGLPPGPCVYLSVSDTGAGMDPDTQTRIFDPFFTTKFMGRGLGLAAALGIVRGHRGAVAVKSEPGRGSTFTVLFPAAETAPGPAPEPGAEEPKAPGLRGTVLFVDDEESVRYMARLMLEKCGYRALAAEDGVEALRVFEQHQNEIDVVVLDLTMPRMNGEETFSRLQELRPDIKVVLSSGFSEGEVTQRFAGRGLAGFIQKPYQYQDLAAKLDALLEPEK